MTTLLKALFLTLILSLTACGATSTPSGLPARLTQKDGQIVIGTAITKPFEYRDEQTNELVGFDVDLIDNILKDVNVEIVWREMAFADLVNEIQAGNVDLVIAGMYITEAREELIDFSTPYLQTGLVLATHQDSGIHTVADLANRTLGVKEGSTGEKYAETLRTGQNIALELRRYTDTITSLEDLNAGLVDAVFNDYINTLEYSKTHPNVQVAGDILQPAGLGISVKTGDSELLGFINQRLKALDDDGTLKTLFNKWINPETAQ